MFYSLQILGWLNRLCGPAVVNTGQGGQGFKPLGTRYILNSYWGRAFRPLHHCSGVINWFNADLLAHIVQGSEFWPQPLAGCDNL